MRTAFWRAAIVAATTAAATMTAVLIPGSDPARAQTQQQIDWCSNKGGAFSAELAISGCTASIRSGKWSGKALTWAFANRCKAYNDRLQYDLALVDCDQALKLDPNDVSAYNNRGNAYSGKGDREHAIADYTRAIELNPKFATAYSNRARQWRGKGDLARAIADLTDAIRINPRDLYGYRERGVMEFNKGDLQSAADDLKRATELGDNPYAMAYRFLVRAHLGEDATAELQDNAARLPTKDWPYPVIELLLGKRTPERTLAAATIEEQRCEANFYIGAWYAVHSDRDKARAPLQTAVDTCPKDFGEYFAAVAELKRLGN
jgi:tetratricopeptide (TPR) repeat protein